MSKFIEFLTDVVSKPDVMAALKKDPEKVMSDAGLSDEEKEIMYTKNVQTLEEYCSKHYKGDTTPAFTNSWWLPLK